MPDPSAQRMSVDILVQLCEWRRLDDAAYLAEAALEVALDQYCEGKGHPPEPQEVAVARRLRLMASSQLQSIRIAVRQLQVNLKEL